MPRFPEYLGIVMLRLLIFDISILDLPVISIRRVALGREALGFNSGDYQFWQFWQSHPRPLPGDPTAPQLIPERRRVQFGELTLRQCQRLAVRSRTAGL